MSNTTTNDLYELPEGLLVPQDDGACDHLLPGTRLPPLSLPATSGNLVDLSALTGTSVAYCYPMTGRPDLGLPSGWDSIPGARGCTPQSCSFRDYHAEITALGARVFGISAQSTEYQREAKERLGLPFELLSDEELRLAESLKLPTFEVERMALIRRLTLIMDGGGIQKVFYPVFPPQENAREVARWLRMREDT